MWPASWRWKPCATCVKPWAWLTAELYQVKLRKDAMTDIVSPWVQRFAPLIPGGEVLDLASGSGRHSRHLAQLGYSVLAVDRDPAALALAAGNDITTSEI